MGGRGGVLLMTYSAATPTRVTLLLAPGEGVRRFVRDGSSVSGGPVGDPSREKGVSPTRPRERKRTSTACWLPTRCDWPAPC
ncbi:transcriptional regulator LuxR family protein [Cystobacter fuscus DSM 2262]|uniref:Transcriptional regulator LuxR family protein n=1 Tax=Cystobacter fuscus (strain ATCC 25194 / DSM 2262 / NBRC 100088 / M29) TaxID=1242864 RepID=S9QFR3_CYSF2|nr:transcriptional regulator LuxR family protein [Cystobacter fuscus DSM 2262]